MLPVTQPVLYWDLPLHLRHPFPIWGSLTTPFLNSTSPTGHWIQAAIYSHGVCVRAPLRKTETSLGISTESIECKGLALLGWEDWKAKWEHLSNTEKTAEGISHPWLGRTRGWRWGCQRLESPGRDPSGGGFQILEEVMLPSCCWSNIERKQMEEASPLLSPCSQPPCWQNLIRAHWKICSAKYSLKSQPSLTEQNIAGRH